MNGLSVRDLLTRDFVGVSEADSVRGAVALMRESHEIGAVVLRGSEAVGTVSALDVLDAVAGGEDLDETEVRDVMQADPPSIDVDTSLGEAASLLSRTRGGILVVTGEDGVLGVITTRDLASVSWEPAEVEEPVSAEVQSEERRTESTPAESYSNQSICEACGSLSRNLMNVNGQLLCPDCRSV
ncbi:MAG: CBS domain-containing protein [Halodesulfurarchaeum sp.]